LIGHGRRIGGVAGINVQCDRPAVGVGHQSVDDAGQIATAVAVVAESGQRAAVSEIRTAADVVENAGVVGKMPSGQLVFDAFLPREEPIESGVKLIDIGIEDVEFFAERGGFPESDGGQLGTGMKDALGDHGDDEIALTGRLACEEGIDSELSEGGKDGVDVAVGQGAEDAELLIGGQEVLAFEDAGDESDLRERECAEIGEGAIFNVAVLAIAFA
jgi:hypothetical protein